MVSIAKKTAELQAGRLPIWRPARANLSCTCTAPEAGRPQAQRLSRSSPAASTYSSHQGRDSMSLRSVVLRRWRQPQTPSALSSRKPLRVRRCMSWLSQPVGQSVYGSPSSVQTWWPRSSSPPHLLSPIALSLQVSHAPRQSSTRSFTEIARPGPNLLLKKSRNRFGRTQALT
jgi:hypothetical protein